MTGRSLSLAIAISAGCAILSGCVADRSADVPAGTVAVNGDADRPEETRAERYARGEYRRGFGHDAARNAEFCRLHPADTDCIGRRY